VTRTRTIRIENYDHARILSSPVAQAFVCIVMTRRGISEDEARALYLDYLNRSAPANDRARATSCIKPV
jgi:hypothetical protein